MSHKGDKWIVLKTFEDIQEIVFSFVENLTFLYTLQADDAYALCHHLVSAKTFKVSIGV